MHKAPGARRITVTVTEDVMRSLEKWAALCIRLAGLALGVLALPWLAALYGAGTRAVLGHLGLPVDEPLSQIAAAGGWLLIALALAGIAVPLARRPRARWVVFAAAVLASGALLGVPLLASLEYATRVGISGWDVVGVVAAAAVVLLMAIKVHNRRYSMHLFYRERLNSAFAVKRRADENGKPVAEPMPYTQSLPFSEIGKRLDERGKRIPELIVCCAVNVTSDGCRWAGSPSRSRSPTRRAAARASPTRTRRGSRSRAGPRARR